MKKYIKNMCAVLSILGSVMGAGFISGAEINSFFTRFGIYGILGLVLSTLLFIIIIFISIKKFAEKSDKLYKNAKNVDFLPFCQLFVSGAMVAGLATMLNNFGLQKVLCYIVVFVLLFLGLLLGIRSANITNIFVSIAIILLLPFVIINAPRVTLINNLQINFSNFLPSVLFACFYVAMNIVASNEVIKHAGKNKVSAIKVSVMFGIIFFGLAVIIMSLTAGASASQEMPMIGVINKGWLRLGYSLLFVVAMLSTLLSSSVGGKNLFKTESNLFNSFCTTSIIFIIGFIGFNNIILYVYPVIGGLMILQLILNYLKHKKLSTTTC